MNTQEFKRKLTAVFSADVVGYSRLMGEDEAATVKTLEAYKQVMFTLIKQHRGRVVDSPGDNLLAEFASVVDAVQCGVAIQKELQARNADLPENRRMEFRIGINLGDVIEEEERIYGDGVNIAARLESLADPGGICVSKTAFDHIESKLPLGYQFLGQQTVKNISKPVGAYKVLMEPRVLPAEGEKKGEDVSFWNAKLVLVGAVAVLVVIICAAVWNFYWRPPRIEPASKDRMAFPLPDKPSVAVLPFVNLSEDPKQEYLADGITENIISALSQIPKLFVIARQSTSAYKGKPVKIQQVAEELGIRYVLEGSVQRSADNLRITAQLIDALGGHHLWSERYDRELKNLFALQDEITLKIITALEVKLTEGERARLFAKWTTNLQAYLLYLQARETFFTVTREGNVRARHLLEEVIGMDSGFPPAYALLGSIHFMDVPLGLSKAPKESHRRALELTKKAIELDESFAAAHSLLGWLHILTDKDYDKAIAECQRAVDLAPSSDSAGIWLGMVLTHAGRHEEAVRYSEQALRLSPIPPAWHLRALGISYFNAGRYEEAIAAHKKALERSPNDILTHEALTAAYTWAGRLEEARTQAGEVLRINSKYSVQIPAQRGLYKNQEDQERYLEGLRKAGLPETPPLPLPDKPSIAVLPFTNMSGDPQQEYFSDGITEEIISALSRVSGLYVIARNSSFTYKGKSVWVPDVARDLGVGYILEGSVRRSGDRIRITAQLIDGKTNHHIWSESYDRELKEVFAIQDEITMKILTNVKVRLTGDEDRIFRLAKRATNLQAYLKILEGLAHLNDSKFTEAKRLYEEALSLDPKSPAHWGLAITYLMDVWFGPPATRAQALGKAFEYGEKCLEQDETNEGCHYTLGYAYTLKRDHGKALHHGRRSIELNPNSPMAASFLAFSLRCAGEYEESVRQCERAIRLDPNGYFHFYMIGTTYVMMRRHEEAIQALRKAVAMNPLHLASWIALVMAYSSLEQMEEARTAAAEVLKQSPNFSVEHFAKAMPYKNEADRVFMADALRKAGMK